MVGRPQGIAPTLEVKREERRDENGLRCSRATARGAPTLEADCEEWKVSGEVKPYALIEQGYYACHGMHLSALIMIWFLYNNFLKNISLKLLLKSK